MYKISRLLLFLPLFGPTLLQATQDNLVPTAPADGYFQALLGGEPFQRAVVSSPVLQLSEQERQSFVEAGRHYGFAIRIDTGEVQGVSPRDAEFNRSVGDTKLLAALNASDKVVTLDFTKGQGTGEWEEPILVPSLRADLILKIVTGTGGPNFDVQEMTMTFVGESNRPRLDVQPNAVNYVLLKLSEIPNGRTIQQLEIHNEGSPTPNYWGSIVFETQEHGNFSLKVLDESNTVTPALVRLQSLDNGMLWDIPDAVDPGPIMTQVTGLPIYGPGKGYTYFMPGGFRGTYWVTDGDFETVLPAGKWELVVHHGVEYTPIKKVVDVKAGEWHKETVTMERWGNMPSRGWYSGDDHVHARILSSRDAKDVITWGKAANVNMLNILEMGNGARTWYEQRGFGPEFRVQDGDFALVPGQEDPRAEFGHIIGQNLTSMARNLDHYMLNDLIADEIHRQGGLYGQTHVGEGGLGIIRDMTWISPFGKSDFVSIMQNILGTERYYKFLNLGFKLTASAGSDTPYGGAVGVTRLYAYLGEDGFSPDAWFDAVKKGNTFATNGPVMDIRVEEVFLPGDTITLKQDDLGKKLSVSVEAWGDPNESAPARVALVWNGKEIHTVQQPNAAAGNATLSYELNPEYGGWLAVRIDSHNGAQAHSTPVYIQREGFRHWNVELAGDLINERFATLDEMEATAKQQKALMESGNMDPLDFWNKWTARQADQIIERTKRAREYYQDLQKTLEEELKLRN